MRVWNAETGKPIGDALRGHRDDVLCISLSAVENRAVSGSRGKTGSMWNAETAEPISDPAHGAPVEFVALPANGKRTASESEDGTVRMWNAGTGDR